MKSTTSFDGQHVLEFNEESHRYKLDGKQVPGATTVGSCYPKGEGLVRWLVQQGIEEYDKKEKLTKAGNIGTVVHKYAESHMTNVPFDWDLVDKSEDSQIIRGCIRQYDDWAAKHPDDKLYSAEGLVASPSLKVGGTIDLLLTRDTTLILRDYKTGKKVYISALHQTVLYRRMLREWCNLNADVIEVLKFTKDPKSNPFEYCFVEKDSMTINGQRIEYPGLLDELELQAVRNVQTYRHMGTVEKLLNSFYKSH